MRKEWVRNSGIVTAIGGGLLAATVFSSPRNDEGADLFMETKKLELDMRSLGSHSQLLGHEKKIYRIQQDPNYKEFRKDNDEKMLGFMSGIVLVLGGTAVAIAASGEAARADVKLPIPRLRHRRT